MADTPPACSSTSAWASVLRPKSQKIAEGLRNIRIGLKEERLHPHQNAPPWLQTLPGLTRGAGDLDPSYSRLQPPDLSSQSCPGNLSDGYLAGGKEFPSNSAHQITTYEHHIRPPSYTWCGFLDRNAYPKRPGLRPEESLELRKIKIVPYFAMTENRSHKTPAEKLVELKENAEEAKRIICLDDRICPDSLRQNFQALLEAFQLQSPESLLASAKMMIPDVAPSGLMLPLPSDETIIKSFACKISREIRQDHKLLLDRYSQAWKNLLSSGHLTAPPLPVRVRRPDFTIVKIIDDFRLTLPSNKRHLLQYRPHASSHWLQLCAICKQFYCEGHFQLDLPPPLIFSTVTDVRPGRVPTPPCGQDCSILRQADWVKMMLKKDKSLEFQNWDHQSKSLLNAIMKVFGPQRLSACDLVKIFPKSSRPCWQLWAAWSTLRSIDSGVYSTIQETPACSNSFRTISSSVPKQLDNLPVETSGYVPCSHSGSCIDNAECDCSDLQTHCDWFCKCSATCPTRYTGCSCEEFCTKDCECVQKLRECNPLLCRCLACDLTHVRSGNENPGLPAPTRAPLSRSAIAAPAPNCGNFLIGRNTKRTFVAPSNIAGMGLFAGEPIGKKDYIGEYAGVLLRAEELETQSVSTNLSSSSYLFDLNKADAVDSSNFGNRARFINEPAHGRRSNAKACVWYVAGTQVTRLFATSRIKSGEEITIDYGSEYCVRDW